MLTYKEAHSKQKPQFESINFLVLSLLYVQLSHPYVTTGKTIALTIQTFVGKVMLKILQARLKAQHSANKDHGI